MTPLVLALLALVLAGPAPWALSRVTALRATPRAAMLLWQSLGLSAVLAALGSSLALATDSALGEDASGRRVALAAFALSVTVVVGGRLLWKGHLVGTRVRALRRRHRDLVDLLATDDGGIRVLDETSLLAYCVPGLRPRVVLSQGARAALKPLELDAVLAHERAHLRARHDLVLEAFTVLHESFPRLVSSAAALAEVELLVEVLADRAAVRRVGAPPLARALVTLVGSAVPDSALGAGGPTLVERVHLLADTSPHRVMAASTVVSAVLVLALPTVFVALPWLEEVGRRL